MYILPGLYLTVRWQQEIIQLYNFVTPRVMYEMFLYGYESCTNISPAAGPLSESTHIKLYLYVKILSGYKLISNNFEQLNNTS
jgi:hypothetical protein